jgi:hypothetical protein
MQARFLLALLSSLLLVVGQASAGLIMVFTEVAGGNGYTGEIPVGGGTLTWVSPPVSVTVPAGQTTGSQVVLGFWSSNVVSVPATPVQLSVDVWDSAYGAPKQLYVNATVSGQIIPNTFDWQFAAMPVQATFADGTVVTVSYQPILMYTGVPVSGPTYYTAFGVEANVTVSAMTPEPSSAVLLAGLTLGGLVARRCRRVVPAK